MQSLQRQASCMSGVRQEDALAIDGVNLYERLGFDTFVQLSTNFYNNVYSDDQQWFRSIFANSTKDDAIQNQYEFFVQRMGGPSLYAHRKGNSALIARHGPYPVTERAAARWLFHMKSALDQTDDIDFDSKTRMFNYFKHTAFFLVAGKELTNHHRLVGNYGVGGKHMGRA
ncbi:hypothetical protein KC19_2G109000 [Ceratodon purpureus]|uniref:Hemoglobin n=1 Tax=Ceratodon purpureus TaxID=3225 RepID=A0A8T0IVH9_CERPU|nr:hypothetical protein KC19_2G109000 [Ceratodon purpureus]